MSKYLCDCHACTYKIVKHGGVYCAAMLRGEPSVHIVSGDSGTSFVFDCQSYLLPTTASAPVQLSFFDLQ